MVRQGRAEGRSREALEPCPSVNGAVATSPRRSRRGPHHRPNRHRPSSNSRPSPPASRTSSPRARLPVPQRFDGSDPSPGSLSRLRQGVPGVCRCASWRWPNPKVRTGKNLKKRSCAPMWRPNGERSRLRVFSRRAGDHHRWGLRCIYFDRDVQGLAAIPGTLATPAGVFVYGRYQQALKERKRKAFHSARDAMFGRKTPDAPVEWRMK